MIKRFSPILSQILIMILIPLLLWPFAYYMDPNDLAMLYVNPHPYLVTSILFSSYFGLRFSILNSTCLMLVYFYLLNLQLDFQIEESIFKLKFVAMPLVMIFCSVVVGDIVERLSNKIADQGIMQAEKEKVIKNQRKTVTYVQDINKELQKRLVEKTDTISQLYEHSKFLNEINQDVLIHNFLKIIHQYANIEQAYFYIKVDHFKFQLKDSYPNSTRPNLGDNFNIKAVSNKLIRKAFQEKKLFHINSIDNPAHMAESIGDILICAPIVVDGNIFGLLIVTHMPFLSYLPNNFSILQIFLDWICNSLKIGFLFSQKSSMGVIDQLLQIYTKDYFEERMNAEIDQANRHQLFLGLLRVNILNIENYHPVKRIPITRVILDLLKESTRKTDIITSGDSENEFFIGLPMTNAKACESIQSRFSKKFEKIQFNPDKEDMNTTITSIEIQFHFRELQKEIKNINDFKGLTRSV